MVDRVGNGPGYGYSPVSDRKVNTNIGGTGEKFQLDYGKEGAIYEPSNETLKKQQETKDALQKTTDQEKKEIGEGVRLTLSDAAYDNIPKSAKTEESVINGLFEKVTDVVKNVLGVIKEFVSRIWNEEPQKEINSVLDEVNTEQDVLSAEKPKTQFEKAKAEAEAFLSSAEGKKVARNSDLLTYYDRHGTVVPVSPSDRQRILYGDKNQMKV